MDSEKLTGTWGKRLLVGRCCSTGFGEIVSCGGFIWRLALIYSLDRVIWFRKLGFLWHTHLEIGNWNCCLLEIESFGTWNWSFISRIIWKLELVFSQDEYIVSVNVELGMVSLTVNYLTYCDVLRRLNLQTSARLRIWLRYTTVFT